MVRVSPSHPYNVGRAGLGWGCAIAHPAFEGPTVRQEATCVATASSLAADSEGYEVYYSTNWFIRTLECFTQ